MLVPVFLALFLPCAGISVVFVVYTCMLWYAANTSSDRIESSLPVKSAPEKGLTASELEKLPRITGKELAAGAGGVLECAVCLDDIEGDQPARQVPGCNHGFHLHCADTWLTRHSVCPVCRAKLDPLLFNSPDHNNPC